MTIALIPAWLLVSAADFSVPPGRLAVHPMSERSIVRKKGWEPHAVPDTKVQYEILSYALPTRPDAGTETLRDVRCAFTLRIDEARTADRAAALDETDGEEACAMGELTQSVLESLRAWKLQVVRDAHPGRHWVELSVHFSEGATVAEVDIERAALASGLPSQPFDGLHVVEPVRARYRVAPQMSPEARALRGEFKCAVTIAFDDTGTPTGVAVKECATPLVDPVVAAAWKWRFHPPTVDGTAVSGEFELEVQFKLK